MDAHKKSNQSLFVRLIEETMNFNALCNKSIHLTRRFEVIINIVMICKYAQIVYFLNFDSHIFFSKAEKLCAFLNIRSILTISNTGFLLILKLYFLLNPLLWMFYLVSLKYTKINQCVCKIISVIIPTGIIKPALVIPYISCTVFDYINSVSSIQSYSWVTAFLVFILYFALEYLFNLEAIANSYSRKSTFGIIQPLTLLLIKLTIGVLITLTHSDFNLTIRVCLIFIFSALLCISRLSNLSYSNLTHFRIDVFFEGVIIWTAIFNFFYFFQIRFTYISLIIHMLLMIVFGLFFSFFICYRQYNLLSSKSAFYKITDLSLNQVLDKLTNIVKETEKFISHPKSRETIMLFIREELVSQDELHSKVLCQCHNLFRILFITSNINFSTDKYKTYKFDLKNSVLETEISSLVKTANDNISSVCDNNTSKIEDSESDTSEDEVASYLSFKVRRKAKLYNNNKSLNKMKSLLKFCENDMAELIKQEAEKLKVHSRYEDQFKVGQEYSLSLVEEWLNHIIACITLNYVNKYANCVELQMIYIDLLLRNKDHRFRAFQQILAVKSLLRKSRIFRTDLHFLAILNDFRSKIESDFESEQIKYIKCTNLLEYNKTHEKLYSEVAKYNEYALRFWQDAILKLENKQAELLEKCSDLNTLAETISFLTSSIFINLKVLNSEILQYMESFSSMACRNTQLKRLLAKVGENRQTKFGSFASENSAPVLKKSGTQILQGVKNPLEDICNKGIIVIKNTPTVSGAIVYSNKIVFDKLGYNKNQLMNKNINYLIIDFISQFHDQFIERFIKTNSSRIIDKSLLLFFKSNNSSLIPIIMTVTVYPSLEDSIKFIAQIDFIDTTEYNMLQPFREIGIDDDNSTSNIKKTPCKQDKDRYYAGNYGFIVTSASPNFYVIGITNQIMESFGIPLSCVYSLNNFKNTITIRMTDLLKESSINLNSCLDLLLIANPFSIKKHEGCITSIDTTFLTPIYQEYIEAIGNIEQTMRNGNLLHKKHKIHLSYFPFHFNSGTSSICCFRIVQLSSDNSSFTKPMNDHYISLKSIKSNVSSPNKNCKTTRKSLCIIDKKKNTQESTENQIKFNFHASSQSKLRRLIYSFYFIVALLIFIFILLIDLKLGYLSNIINYMNLKHSILMGYTRLSHAIICTLQMVEFGELNLLDDLKELQNQIATESVTSLYVSSLNIIELEALNQSNYTKYLINSEGGYSYEDSHSPESISYVYSQIIVELGMLLSKIESFTQGLPEDVVKDALKSNFESLSFHMKNEYIQLIDYIEKVLEIQITNVISKYILNPGNKVLKLLPILILLIYTIIVTYLFRKILDTKRVIISVLSSDKELRCKAKIDSIVLFGVKWNQAPEKAVTNTTLVSLKNNEFKRSEIKNTSFAFPIIQQSIKKNYEKEVMDTKRSESKSDSNWVKLKPLSNLKEKRRGSAFENGFFNGKSRKQNNCSSKVNNELEQQNSEVKLLNISLKTPSKNRIKVIIKEEESERTTLGLGKYTGCFQILKGRHQRALILSIICFVITILFYAVLHITYVIKEALIASEFNRKDIIYFDYSAIYLNTLFILHSFSRSNSSNCLAMNSTAVSAETINPGISQENSDCYYISFLIPRLEAKNSLQSIINSDFIMDDIVNILNLFNSKESFCANFQSLILGNLNYTLVPSSQQVEEDCQQFFNSSLSHLKDSGIDDQLNFLLLSIKSIDSGDWSLKTSKFEFLFNLINSYFNPTMKYLSDLVFGSVKALYLDEIQYSYNWFCLITALAVYLSIMSIWVFSSLKSNLQSDNQIINFIIDEMDEESHEKLIQYLEKE